MALFRNRAQAEPVRALLADVGILAEVHDGPGWARLWFVSKRAAGVRLEVAVHQAQRAKHLLHEWDAAQGILRHAIRCVECKSLRVAYPQFTRKSLLTNLVMGLAAELGLVEKDYYCEDCHYMWGKQGKRRHRSRQHLAPDYFIEGS